MTSVENTTQYKLWVNGAGLNEIHVFTLPESINPFSFEIYDYMNFLDEHGISRVEEWGFITDIVYHTPKVMKSDNEYSSDE